MDKISEENIFDKNIYVMVLWDSCKRITYNKFKSHWSRTVWCECNIVKLFTMMTDSFSTMALYKSIYLLTEKRLRPWSFEFSSTLPNLQNWWYAGMIGLQ